MRSCDTMCALLSYLYPPPHLSQRELPGNAWRGGGGLCCGDQGAVVPAVPLHHSQGAEDHHRQVQPHVCWLPAAGLAGVPHFPAGRAPRGA